jgi:type I restriction enzyme S subunit
MELTKSKYKSTEVGLIPEDWELIRLGDFMKLKNGYAFSSEYFSNRGPIVMTPGNFKLNGGLKFEERNTIRFSGQFTKEMCFNNGDLIMVMTDLTPDCNLLGKSGIVDSTEILLHNQRIGKIIIQNSNLDKGYLNVYFNSWLYSNRMKSTATGSTVRHTSVPTINNTVLTLPTLAEQKSIATALSDVDALIFSLEKLIAKKKAIKQGAMQELLTPKDNWRKVSLFELADGKKSNFDDGDWIESEYITDKGIRLIQTGNIGVGNFIDKTNKKYISEDSFSKLKCKEVLEGDLLICRLAEPAGRACVMPNIGESKVITSVDVSIFRGDSNLSNRVFLSQYFTTQDWFNEVIERVGGTTHKRISRGSLGRIEFLIPSLKEQESIAEVLFDMDLNIQSLDNKKAKYQEIKQGMMQELLTGKTRLI